MLTEYHLRYSTNLSSISSTKLPSLFCLESRLSSIVVRKPCRVSFNTRQFLSSFFSPLNLSSIQARKNMSSIFVILDSFIEFLLNSKACRVWFHPRSVEFLAYRVCLINLRNLTDLSSFCFFSFTKFLFSILSSFVLKG